jgi:nicotinate-nucleotide pyrophosphorylase (carboxylating)
MSTDYTDIVEAALAEDIRRGDITTELLIPDTTQGTGVIRAKANGVLAGTGVAKEVFLKVDPQLNIRFLLEDGATIATGDTIARIDGRVASILKAERVALNFLQHLSGIASSARQYCSAIEGLPTVIKDTRKTIPGLRALEKSAVKSGGGRNHRMHLSDGILIKDTHLQILYNEGLHLKEIIERARSHNNSGLQIEVEVKTPQEAIEAVEAGADIIMLDNMSPGEMQSTVRLVKGRALIEASGGITLENVRSIAETGVDFISVGALTHSAKALDINLTIEER